MVLALMGYLTQNAQVLPTRAEDIEFKTIDEIMAENVEPTIESNEVDVVALPDEDEWTEEFCDSLEILACCVEAEAGNQDFLGKRLVADVILNRVESDRFPDTIEEVISQKYHFTTYWDGTIDNVIPSDETFEAVQMELYGERYDPNILFFTAGNYNTYCTPAYRHQDHYFGY